MDVEGQLCNRGNTTHGYFIKVDLSVPSRIAESSRSEFKFDMDHIPIRGDYFAKKSFYHASLSLWPFRWPASMDPNGAYFYTTNHAHPFAKIFKVRVSDLAVEDTLVLSSKLLRYFLSFSIH